MSNEVKTDEQLINELVAHGIIDAIGEAVSIQDTNFKILYQNQQHKDMVGDHLGKYCYNAYQDRDNVCDECPLALCFKDGGTHKLEQMRTTDPGVVHYEITGSPVKDTTGKIIAGIEVFRDITRRKNVEKLLQDSNEKLQGIVFASPVAILTVDREGNITYWSPAAERIFGWSAQEVIGCFNPIVPEEKLEEFRVNLSQVLKGETFIREARRQKKDGSFINVIISTAVLCDKEGNMIGAVAVIEDITERKKVEDALIKSRNELEMRVKERTQELEKINQSLLLEIAERKKVEKKLHENEERFRTVAETSTDLIWEGDVRHDSLVWHGDIDRILGYKQGEFPRTVNGHLENVHPEDRESLLKLIGNALETGKDFYAVYRIRCKAGSYRYWEERGKAVGFEGGRAVQWAGSVTDISDKKKAEEQMHKSNEMYKKLSQEFNILLDAIPDNLILLSPDLRIVWLNKAAASGFGRDASELTAKYCYKLCCSIFVPCENCPALKSFRSGEEEDVQITTAQGRVWDIRAFPVKDGSGVKNVIEVARDITERIRMEQEAKMMQTKLIHANKMTSLGTLVSGVVHEINNPNSYILSNAQLFGDIWKDVVKILSKHYRGKEDFQLGGLWFSKLRKTTPEMIDGIIDGSMRINNIINTLKNFARQDGTGIDGKVDIKRTIKYSRAILSSQIEKVTRKFRVTVEKKLPPVKGNSQQIEQVILNLIMNSLQALPDKDCGVLISASVSKRPGFVLISVKDEGVGMTKDVIDRATEPFFTTRLDRGGTGLGLSISYSIIKEHGGTMEFESGPGRGTTVSLELPVYDAG